MPLIARVLKAGVLVDAKIIEYLRGWVSYFGIQEFRVIFRAYDGWIPSRLRSMQLKKWKEPRKFQRMLVGGGDKPDQARRLWVKLTNGNRSAGARYDL